MRFFLPRIYIAGPSVCLPIATRWRGNFHPKSARPLSAPTGHAIPAPRNTRRSPRSEEHTSELQSLMRTSYAVFRLHKTQTPQHQQLLLTPSPTTTPTNINHPHPPI